VLLIHRVGRLLPTDQIVLVAVASAHRGEAFAACEFIIDYLKTRAPFWKREVTARGRALGGRASGRRAGSRALARLIAARIDQNSCLACPGCGPDFVVRPETIRSDR
jgi:hypothetical protein